MSEIEKIIQKNKVSNMKFLVIDNGYTYNGYAFYSWEKIIDKKVFRSVIDVDLTSITKDGKKIDFDSSCEAYFKYYSQVPLDKVAEYIKGKMNV